jgi:hypothetical protein
MALHVERKRICKSGGENLGETVPAATPKHLSMRLWRPMLASPFGVSFAIVFGEENLS